jgi:hypothetical protein
MKPKDIFAIAVRMIGLIFLYQGLSAVPSALANICPIFPHIFWRNVWPASVLVGWPLLLAWWLVRGAPWLMKLAFPEDQLSPRHNELVQRP